MQKNLLKYINMSIVILCCGFIFGCSKPTSMEYYLDHPGEIPAALAVCNKDPGLKTSERCKNVLKAYALTAAYLSLAESHPQEFGQRILAIQMQIADLQTKLQTIPFDSAENAKIRAQLQSLTQQNQQFLAVIGMLGV